MIKFLVLAFILASFSIYLTLSYINNSESEKKHWQKGKPYSKLDKIFGISLGIAIMIVAIISFIKAFYLS